MIKEFKDFLMRGNVIDLAVAVVIGAAFGAVVTSFVTNILTPLIAMIFGEPSFSGMSFSINGAEFNYGAFLDALFAFASIAAAVFFFVVRPINMLDQRRKAGLDPDTKECPECLSEVPFGARRCAHCTSEIGAAA